ncbi:hypothetical protein SOVF_065750 [Spinacia oleracea]|nr:hypothetical protein SOVF_065750 [Spinacia oleracea]
MSTSVLIEFPPFRVPNLKLFHLGASLISGDDFLTRLVSSCPLLEDLSVKAWWNNRRYTSISSTSLRKLCLGVYEYWEDTNPDTVLIYTPNLEHLIYIDNLALHYNIPKMHNLVIAELRCYDDLFNEDIQVSGLQVLNLIRALSNVQHLSFHGCFTRDLSFVEVKDLLPMLPNLKRLELGFNLFTYWDKALLPFLNCSPILETLVFPEGIMTTFDTEVELLELETRFCTTSQEIPLCCRSHLKRIVIENYYGKERDFNLTRFLLRHALVLEELVIRRSTIPGDPIADPMTIESMLRSFPRASLNCSFQVQ